MDAMRADWSKNIKDGFIALTCWYVFMFACNVYVANQREAQVFGAEFGEQGTTSTEIRRKIEADGYVFAAKYPGMAVNEALNALEEDKRAFVAAKRGIAKVWTRTGSKEPTE